MSALRPKETRRMLSLFKQHIRFKGVLLNHERLKYDSTFIHHSIQIIWTPGYL